MPKYKIVAHNGSEIGCLSVHDHATGKSQQVKPDKDGNFTLDRAQARILAQGNLVRALEGEGLVEGTPSIKPYVPEEVLKTAPKLAVSKETLLAKDPKDLIETAKALAISLDGKESPEKIADLILARVAAFDSAKERIQQANGSFVTK